MIIVSGVPSPGLAGVFGVIIILGGSRPPVSVLLVGLATLLEGTVAETSDPSITLILFALLPFLGNSKRLLQTSDACDERLGLFGGLPGLLRDVPVRTSLILAPGDIPRLRLPFVEA